jgi:hypothetical protein
MANEKENLTWEQKIALIKIASTDPLFLCDIDEISEDFYYLDYQ